MVVHWLFAVTMPIKVIEMEKLIGFFYREHFSYFGTNVVLNLQRVNWLFVNK